MRLNYIGRFMLVWISVSLAAHNTLAHEVQLHPDPKIFYDQKAIADGVSVYSAVLSKDSNSRKVVLKKLGSMLVFDGESPPQYSGPNLLVKGNVLLEIDIPGWKAPQAICWTARVAGRLESVDFQRHIIHIRAKRENWRSEMQM